MTTPVSPFGGGQLGAEMERYLKTNTDNLMRQGGLASGYQVSGMQIQPNSPVWIGPTKPYSMQDAITKGGTPGQFVRSDSEMTFGEAANLPLQWSYNDPNTLRRFVNTGILRKIRGFNVNMGMPEILDAWQNMLEQSWRMNTAEHDKPGGQPWTPWDVMETYSNAGNFGTVKSADGDWLVDAGTGERVKYIGPKSKKTTEKRVNLSSPEDVRALTTQMLSELLGRSPTAAEMARYRASINEYEKANPQVATTTVTLNDMGEQVASETTTSGGASQAALQEIVSGSVKEQDEYGKYQGGARYFNLLERLVGGG